MTQITLKPIRQQTTVTLLATLTDNGVKIDWSDLSVVKAYIYSESQRVVAGPCTVQVDGEDPTILRCVYDASKPQYLGTQKLVIYCEYEGQKNTYDKAAFTFVASTAATVDDGTTVSEDTTDVDITVEDVSSSILSGAIKAALDAAEFANETAESVQERADQDHTRAEEDHSTAASDHTRAAADHTTAAADHTQAAADHNLAAADHVQAGLDHTQASADHGVAVSDHGQAGQDHTRAESDHSTAASDHTKAGQDHTRAESDHTQAAADHTLAGTDHSTAAADHTQAASDHTTAAADHTLAASDHSTAAADHTQALADHQVMQGYDTRLTNVEGEVSQLGQKVDDLDDTINGESPQEYHFGELVPAIIASDGVVNASSPRCGYYIPVDGGEDVSIKGQTGLRAFYCPVKSIVTTGGQSADLATGYSGAAQTTKGGSASFTIPDDAEYLYIGYITTSDASIIVSPAELVINDWDVVNNRYIGEITPGLVDRVGALEKFHGLLRLQVSEHNEGGYNYGESPSGIPQENYDSDVMGWKTLLTKTNSDFLSVMEHSHILNKEESGVTNVDSYVALYEQFYPYKYDGSATHKYALFSKYPIKSSESVNFSVTDRYFDKHIVVVNGIEICIIIFKGYVGIPGTEGATNRVAEFTELVGLLADNPIVIIPIDTNSQYTDDFDVFRNNGYQLGNFGYWGEKKTCGISETYPQGHYAFDNIIVKGLNINSFDVCDEHATSDHFPTMAKLTKFFD